LAENERVAHGPASPSVQRRRLGGAGLGRGIAPVVEGSPLLWRPR
jgi:hypothetical protein